MSHASKQIRDWFIASCTGVVGLPNAREGSPRQLPANVDACFVRTTGESCERITISLNELIDERTLAVEVGLIANTHTEVDAYSVLAEEAIAASGTYPGKELRLTSRAYEENYETDRNYVGLTLAYEALYYVEDIDVETFK